MDLENPKFAGDLGLSPTALAYANLYQDVYITLAQAAPHLKSEPGTILNQLSDKKKFHPIQNAGFFILGGKNTIHVQDLANFIDEQRLARKLEKDKKRNRGASKKAERMAVGG